MPRKISLSAVKIAFCLTALYAGSGTIEIANAQATSTLYSQATDVVGEGFGTTEQAAIDSAVKNALMSAAGSYINSETNFERKSNIENGIRNWSKSLIERTSEYSNGIVKNVRIIYVNNYNGNFRSKVSITVLQGELRSYVLELAEGKNKISEGLFSEVKANAASAQSLESALNQIIEPILDGTALKIEVSKPVSANRGEVRYITKEFVNSVDRNINIDDPFVVLVRVKISIDDNYMEKIIDFFDYSSIDSKNITRFESDLNEFYFKHAQNYKNSVVEIENRDVFKAADETQLRGYSLEDEKNKAYAFLVNPDRFILQNFCRQTFSDQLPDHLKTRKLMIVLYNNSGFFSSRTIIHHNEKEYSFSRETLKSYVIVNGKKYEYTAWSGNLINNKFSTDSVMTRSYPNDEEGDLIWSNIQCEGGLPFYVRLRTH